MIFTSEQVSCGHPDKICDQISDAIVTDCLAHDKRSRVAAECMIKDFDIIIAGEITSSHAPNYEALARKVLRRIGVFGAEDFRIQTFISKQSADIALGVDGNGRRGRGVVPGPTTTMQPPKTPVPSGAGGAPPLSSLGGRGVPVLFFLSQRGFLMIMKAAGSPPSLSAPSIWRVRLLRIFAPLWRRLWKQPPRTMV